MLKKQRKYSKDTCFEFKKWCVFAPVSTKVFLLLIFHILRCKINIYLETNNEKMKQVFEILKPIHKNETKTVSNL